jgi:hypothetical protein
MAVKVSVDGRRWFKTTARVEATTRAGCPRIVKHSRHGNVRRLGFPCGRPLKPGLNVCALHDPDLARLRSQIARDRRRPGHDGSQGSPSAGLVLTSLAAEPSGERRWVWAAWVRYVAFAWRDGRWEIGVPCADLPGKYGANRIVSGCMDASPGEIIDARTGEIVFRFEEPGMPPFPDEVRARHLRS